MSPRATALVGGAAGSLLVFGLLFWRKKVTQLDPMVANVEAAAAGTAEGRSVMARRAAQLTQHLQTLGEQKTEEIANATAEAYIASQYGLTADRIASLKRIASVFGT